MPNLVLGIATVTFKDNYPTIDGDIEFTVPADVPDVGGKSYSLPGFSLSAKTPSMNIAVDIPQFSGSIAVSLDFAHASLDVQGSIQLTTPTPYNWPVGPGSAAYAVIPARRQPSTTATMPAFTLSELQDALNSAPAGNRLTPNPPHVDVSEVTKLALEAMLFFYGMEWIKEVMQANLNACVQSLNQSQQALAAKGGPADIISANGVVFAVGTLVDLGVAVGVSAGVGFLMTSDGDFGLYGSFSLGLGVICEIAVSVTGSVYWGAKGQSGLQAFSGKNFVVSGGFTEFLSFGFAIAWAVNEQFAPISDEPVGITISVGVGLSLEPAQVFISGSDTFLYTVLPPALPPGGYVIYQGDTSYWSAGFQLYWFSSWTEALAVDGSGDPAWSTGTGSIKSATITAMDVPLSGMPSGVMTVAGNFSGAPQLFLISNYQDTQYLQLGADGEQPGSAIYQQPIPSNFQATSPPSISAGMGFKSTPVLACAFYSTCEEAIGSWNGGGNPLGGGQLSAGGQSVMDIPSGWNWLVIYEGAAFETPILITQFLSTMTGMVDQVNGQTVFYVT